jgi:hypothetical protein
MVRLTSAGWKIAAAICMMLAGSNVAIGQSTSSTEKPLVVLTGRFAARINGPPLTSFGQNHESYIFEITSSSQPQFVLLSYTFLQYQPLLPSAVFDYSRVYTVEAEQEEQCGQTIEEISKVYAFDEYGRFMGVKYEIDYSKNFSPASLPMKTRLSCYLLDPQSVSLIH